MQQSGGRGPDEIRPLNFELNVAPHASGSLLVSMGKTRVICAVTIEEGVPRWMKEQGVSGGWLTAEYSMLPYSTQTRKPRDNRKRSPRWSQRRDSAFDWPLAASGCWSRKTRAAHGLDRLRHAASRWRNTHHGNHRSQPSTRHSLPATCEEKKARPRLQCKNWSPL